MSDRGVGRQPRGAAQRAIERLEEQQEPIVISSSEGESRNSDAEEVEERESSEGEAAAPPALSEYERQRAENIAKNHAVLQSLGLAGTPSPAPTAARRARTSSSEARRGAERGSSSGSGGRRTSKRARVPSRSPSVASAASDDDDSSNDLEGAQQDTAKAVASNHPASGKKVRGAMQARPQQPAEASGLESVDADDVAAFYRILVNAGRSSSGDNGALQGGLLTPRSIIAIAKELQLDCREAFTPEKAALMIECFDGGGKGGLTLSEFEKTFSAARGGTPP